MTATQARDEMLERRRKAFYRERAWWWSGPTGKVKIGVLRGIGQENWIVGHIKDNGSRQKFNSAQLSKYQPSTDPERLLKIVGEWAVKRDLQEVQW